MWGQPCKVYKSQACWDCWQVFREMVKREKTTEENRHTLNNLVQLIAAACFNEDGVEYLINRGKLLMAMGKTLYDVMRLQKQ